MLAAAALALPLRLAGPGVGSLLALRPALLRTLSTAAGVEDDDAPAHDKKLVDRLKIQARGGKGGNGCVSFYQGASRGASCRPSMQRQRA